MSDWDVLLLLTFLAFTDLFWVVESKFVSFWWFSKPAISIKERVDLVFLIFKVVPFKYLKNWHFDEAFQKTEALQNVVSTFQLDDGEAKQGIWEVRNHHIGHVSDLPSRIHRWCFVYFHQAAKWELKALPSYKNVIRNVYKEEGEATDKLEYHTLPPLNEFQIMFAFHEVEQGATNV